MLGDTAATANALLRKIKGDFIYENSQLYLKAFNFLNENERYTVSGSFPININFINMDKNLSELPLNILITGKSNNFNLLTSNIDNVEYLNGDISIQLSIGGNYKRPIRNGQLIIRNGTLSLLNINNTFNDINLLESSCRTATTLVACPKPWEVTKHAIRSFCFIILIEKN